MAQAEFHGLFNYLIVWLAALETYTTFFISILWIMSNICLKVCYRSTFRRQCVSPWHKAFFAFFWAVQGSLLKQLLHQTFGLVAEQGSIVPSYSYRSLSFQIHFNNSGLQRCKIIELQTPQTRKGPPSRALVIVFQQLLKRSCFSPSRSSQHIFCSVLDLIIDPEQEQICRSIITRL